MTTSPKRRRRSPSVAIAAENARRLAQEHAPDGVPEAPVETHVPTDPEPLVGPTPRIDGDALVLAPAQYDELHRLIAERTVVQPTGWQTPAQRERSQRAWRDRTLVDKLGLPAADVAAAPDALRVVVQHAPPAPDGDGSSDE